MRRVGDERTNLKPKVFPETEGSCQTAAGGHPTYFQYNCPGVVLWGHTAIGGGRRH